MYSDHEVECMYLGIPFEEKTLHYEDPVTEVTHISREITHFPMDKHPLLAIAASGGGK